MRPEPPQSQAGVLRGPWAKLFAALASLRRATSSAASPIRLSALQRRPRIASLAPTAHGDVGKAKPRASAGCSSLADAAVAEPPGRSDIADAEVSVSQQNAGSKCSCEDEGPMTLLPRSSGHGIRALSGPRNVKQTLPVVRFQQLQRGHPDPGQITNLLLWTRWIGIVAAGDCNRGRIVGRWPIG